MPRVDFMRGVYEIPRQDSQRRSREEDQARCAEVAYQFGKDYWDGDRKFGYGGYHYDGRWRSIADLMVQHYGLKSGGAILEVGCGKGFFLHDFTQALPGCRVTGVDVSEYAAANALDSVRPFIHLANANQLPFPDQSFDLVVSTTTLQLLFNYDLFAALKEIQRVGRGARHVIVPAYRSEREKVKLMNHQPICRAFMTPAEWEWLFQHAGYEGDWQFRHYDA